jgi:hypothetical protein
LQKLELPPTPNLLPPQPQPQQSPAATSCSHSSLSTFNTTKTTTTTRGLLRCVAWRAKKAIYNLVTLPQTSPKPSKEAALDHGIRKSETEQRLQQQRQPTVLRFVATSDLEEISKTNRGVQEFCICTGIVCRGIVRPCYV